MAHKAKRQSARALDDYASGTLSREFVRGLATKNGIAYRDIYRGFKSTVREVAGESGAAVVKVISRDKTHRHSESLGFVVDRKGIVIVDGKIIEGANKTSVHLKDGTVLEADVVELDTESSIAILQVESKKPLPALEITQLDNSRRGDWAVFVGFQSSRTISGGVVLIAGFDRYKKHAPNEHYILIDVNDSSICGSPLLNFEGKVIGMNVTTSSDSPYGYVVPAKRFSDLVSDVRTSDRKSPGR